MENQAAAFIFPFHFTPQKHSIPRVVEEIMVDMPMPGDTGILPQKYSPPFPEYSYY